MTSRPTNTNILTQQIKNVFLCLVEHLLFPPDCLSSHRARLSCSSFWPLKSFLNPTFCAGNQNQSCVFRCVSVCVERRLCGCQHWLLWSSSFPPPCIKNKTNFLYYPRRMLWYLCSLQSRMRHISPTQKKKKKRRYQRGAGDCTLNEM